MSNAQDPMPDDSRNAVLAVERLLCSASIRGFIEMAITGMNTGKK
jgi:hypothetical protein